MPQPPPLPPSTTALRDNAGRGAVAIDRSGVAGAESTRPRSRVRPGIAAREALTSAWLPCSVLMLVALAFRLYLLATKLAYVDGDQAVLGIMAFHVQEGDHPVFYYGQSYMGALEAYLAAAIFPFTGASDLTLRLPTLAFSVAFVGLVYWLGAMLYSRWIAALAALFLALGPAILTTWSTVAGAGYIEVMVCGTLLFILAVHYPDLRTMPAAAALATGFLAGFGIWMQPMIGEYLAPLAVAFTLRLIGRRGGSARAGLQGVARALALIGAGVVVGGAPFFLYNLTNGGATFTQLGARASGSGHIVVAQGFTSQTLPILLGLVTPTTVPRVFGRLAADHPLQYWIGVVVGTYLFGRLVLDPSALPLRIASLVRPGHPHPSPQAVATGASTGRVVGSDSTGSDAGDGVLALFTVTCLLLFLFTGFGSMSWAVSLPRYLIPIYTITPLVFACFMPRHPRTLDKVFASVAVCLLIVTGVRTTLAAEGRPSVGGLAHRLEARHVRLVYTDYWLANQLAFESRERVLGVVIGDNLALGHNRFPAYVAATAAIGAEQQAWLFVRGGPGEMRFLKLLARRHVRASHWRWHDEVVYDHLSQSVQPAAGAGTAGQ